MANVNGVENVSYDKTETYKMADSQSLTVFDPVYLSSGKVAKSTDTLATNIIGFAAQTKSMGVLATVGQQEYIGVHRKGRMAFTGLKDAGSYTSDIAIGDQVSVYYDGTNYYVVKNATNPIGTVVEGSMDTVGSSTTIIVDVDLTSENVQPAELQFPFRVPTDNKIEFRDAGIFIQSDADGKLLISSDGSGADDIHFTGNVTIDNDLTVAGTSSMVNPGGTFTGTVQINDNNNLQFEGVAADSNGFVLDCDASGDATISCTAGMIDFSTKDGVVRFADSDVATDYVDIITGSGSSIQVFAAEPSGKFRFKDAGDANNSDVLDFTLTDAGSANVINSAVKLTVSTTAGNVVLASAADIDLNPTGNDVHFTVSAGKITMAATSTTIYGGDTGGDDLVLYANSSDADPVFSLLGGGGFTLLQLDQDVQFQYDASNYLKLEMSSAGVATWTTVTGSTDGMVFVTAVGNITLTSAADIAMTAGGNDITMDSQLTITATAADQLVLAYDGSNYFGFDVDSDGSTTLTTTGTDADFEIATGTTGDITLDAAAALVFEPATTATFTLAAAGQVILDADTTDSTAADVLLINVGVNSANCNAIGIDLDVGTALSAAELAKGVYVDANAKAADADTSAILAFDALITAVSTARSDLYGFRVLFDGTMDTGDGVKGVVVDGSSFTMNDTAGVVHGVNVEFASLTDTDYATGEFNGIDVTMPATYQGTDTASAVKLTGAGGQVDLLTGAGTITACNVVLDATDNNAYQGLVISKDMTVTAANGVTASTNSALSVESVNASSASADGAMTVANTLGSFTMTNSNAVANADVYSGTVLALAYNATTTGAGTATSTATALGITYLLTETAGTLTVDDHNVFDINWDTVGTVAFADSTCNMINVNMGDDSVNVYGTVALNGMTIDCSGLDVSDATLTLKGINVVMPGTYGAATEYGIYVAGDGTTVSICNDGAVGVEISGTLTAGLQIPAGATTTDGIVIADACSANGISITGACADGMEISGACTSNGINISADCQTGLAIANQTTAGVTIGATGIGVQIGATTTALDITGATTQVFDFTGVTGAVAEDSKAYPDKAGSIKIITPAGATAYINYYDGTAA